MAEWSKFVKNQVTLQGGNIPGPKLICIDLQPHVATQAPERSDILNVGGFSDAVFKVMAAFMNDDVNRFVTEISQLFFVPQSLHGLGYFFAHRSCSKPSLFGTYAVGHAVRASPMPVLVQCFDSPPQ
jgi:hypothetical protein